MGSEHISPRGWPCGLQLSHRRVRMRLRKLTASHPPRALDDGHGSAGFHDWLWSSLLSSGPHFGNMTTVLNHCAEAL